MKEDLEKIIDEAIQLEMNVAELYQLFHELFPEDAQFWKQLSSEEEHHATLLRTVKLMEASDLLFSLEALPGGWEELNKTNQKIGQAIEDFRQNPDRHQAFHLAFELENSAGELHYNIFMKSKYNKRGAAVFRDLNGDDMDHASRIEKYMKQNHIS